MGDAKFAPVKDRPTGPVKVFDESEALKSSNTWEFLIFEQIRAIRFIQNSLFSEPRMTKFFILNLVSSMNHLESMLYDRINPNYEANTEDWMEYQRKKPAIFKNLHKNVDKLRTMVAADEYTQFQLVASIEIWFRAMDKYLNSIKRISPTMYEMHVPDILTANLEQMEEFPVSPHTGAPDPNLLESFVEGGDSD